MSSNNINVYSSPIMMDQSNFDDRYSVDVAPPAILELGDNNRYCTPPRVSRNSSLKFVSQITLPIRLRVLVSFDSSDINKSLSELERRDTVDDDSFPYDCPPSPPSVPICGVQRFCKTPPPVSSTLAEVPPLIKRRRLSRFESKFTSDCPPLPTFDSDCNYTSPFLSLQFLPIAEP